MIMVKTSLIFWFWHRSSDGRACVPCPHFGLDLDFP